MSATLARRELPPEGLSWLGFIGDRAPELLPKHNDDYPGGNVTVIGSFKGWHTEIVPTRERIRAAGFFPLAPHGNEITHYAGADGDFEVVDADASTIRTMEDRIGRKLSGIEVAELLESLFCAAIQESDFTYVAGLPRDEIDDGGYVGLQVATELGIALHNGPVYGTEISRTLDERDGYISNFAGQVGLIKVVSPEGLGQLYAGGVKP